MNITIVAVGRIRSKETTALCDDYQSRIGRYGHEIKVYEVKDEPGNREPARVLVEEEKRLVLRIPEGAYKIALDRSGKTFSSPELAEHFKDLMMKGINKVTFIIGGPLGLNRTLVESCDWVFSLSRLTFPHELARLILLEQIYRANTIIRGEPYHK